MKRLAAISIILGSLALGVPLGGQILHLDGRASGGDTQAVGCGGEDFDLADKSASDQALRGDDSNPAAGSEVSDSECADLTVYLETSLWHEDKTLHCEPGSGITNAAIGVRFEIPSAKVPLLQSCMAKVGTEARLEWPDVTITTRKKSVVGVGLHRSKPKNTKGFTHIFVSKIEAEIPLTAERGDVTSERKTLLMGEHRDVTSESVDGTIAYVALAGGTRDGILERSNLQTEQGRTGIFRGSLTASCDSDSAIDVSFTRPARLIIDAAHRPVLTMNEITVGLRGALKTKMGTWLAKACSGGPVDSAEPYECYRDEIWTFAATEIWDEEELVALEAEEADSTQIIARQGNGRNGGDFTVIGRVVVKIRDRLGLIAARSAYYESHFTTTAYEQTERQNTWLDPFAWSHNRRGAGSHGSQQIDINTLQFTVVLRVEAYDLPRHYIDEDVDWAAWHIADPITLVRFGKAHGS